MIDRLFRAPVLLAAALGTTLATAPASAQGTTAAPPAWVRRYLAAEHHGDHFAHAWLARGAQVAASIARASGPGASANPFGAAIIGATTPQDIRGTFKVAVLATTYSDVTPLVATSSIDTMLFAPGGYARGYSLASFYSFMSGGRFTVAGTVTPWMKLSKPRSAYGPTIQSFIHDALVRADSTVDWRQFDNDGPDGIPDSGDDDGYVDLAIILHPLADGVCGTGPNYGPTGTGWRVSVSGAFGGQPFVTRRIGANGQPIKVEDFVLAGSLDCSGNGPAPVNITAHEMGHALGLPDLYDLDHSSFGVGCWDLMGYGIYLADGSPGLMSAWTRARLGWMDVTTVTANTHLDIPPAESSAVAYRVDIPGTSEYLLLENRQRIGPDANLPGAGLLVWHVNDSVLAQRLPHYGANEDENHPGLLLLQADGRQDLKLRANTGDAGDPFPGATQNVLLNDGTSPSSVAAAGTPSWLQVGNITVNGDVVSADIAVARGLAEPDGTRIMSQLMGQGGLSAAEQSQLDKLGNHNGVFDVGDVLAWTGRHGGAAAAISGLPHATQRRAP